MLTHNSTTHSAPLLQSIVCMVARAWSRRVGWDAPRMGCSTEALKHIISSVGCSTTMFAVATSVAIPRLNSTARAFGVLTVMCGLRHNAPGAICFLMYRPENLVSPAGRHRIRPVAADTDACRISAIHQSGPSGRCRFKRPLPSKPLNDLIFLAAVSALARWLWRPRQRRPWLALMSSS